jgi:hypothetical protein
MTTFDDREKAYEKKFALDADLKFKAEQRRNKVLAEWAGAKMGLSGSALEDYIKACASPTSLLRATTTCSPRSRPTSRRRA